MKSLYGDEWDVELAEHGGPEPSAYTQADEAEAAEEGAEQRAGAVSAPAALAPPRSPTPGAKSPVGSARDSGGSGIADSWNSQDPGTPGALGERAKRSYDPCQETYSQYEVRFKRQAEILDVHGFGLPVEEQELCLLKAKLHAAVVEAQKGSQEGVINELKKDFALALLELSPDGAGQLRYKALTELLESYGVDTKVVKSRLAEGVPLTTPTPPKGGGDVQRTLFGSPNVHDIATPLGRTSPGAEVPPMPNEIEEMRKRLEVAEVILAAQSLEGVRSPMVVYGEIMKTQQRTVDVLETLAKAKSAPPTSMSTIRVEPKVT